MWEVIIYETDFTRIYTYYFNIFTTYIYRKNGEME